MPVVMVDTDKFACVVNETLTRVCGKEESDNAIVTAFTQAVYVSLTTVLLAVKSSEVRPPQQI